MIRNWHPRARRCTSRAESVSMRAVNFLKNGCATALQSKPSLPHPGGAPLTAVWRPSYKTLQLEKVRKNVQERKPHMFAPIGSPALKLTFWRCLLQVVLVDCSAS